MSDDEFVEGNSESASADAPGVVPADDGKDAKQGGFDSSSVHDAPVMQTRNRTARTQQSRKAFAEAVLASKKETATKPPSDVDEFDPEAPAAPVAAKSALAATDDAAVAKAAGADPAPPKPVVPAALTTPAAPTAAPAPSLDPEVRQLVQQLKAEREQIVAERAEIERAKKAAAEPAPLPDSHSLEGYIDSPPTAYRNWLESMRGEKFATDDEFKSEVSDFITMLSSDVLGVPLPENVRVKLDAAQAKKIVRTHKTIQTRKEAAAAAKAEKDHAEATSKAEIERVEQEWGRASAVLSQQFTPANDAEGKPAASTAAKAYPWLAAEDEPGKIIVDVIRAAVGKDGTQLSWQEASQRANDYLADQAKKYYDKRRPLLTAAPAAAPSVAKPVVTPPPATATKAPTAPQMPNKWSRDAHTEKTKAAFRAMIAAKPE